MKKTTLMLCILTAFFVSELSATRDYPRVGRNVWRMIRDATPTPIENKDAVAGKITIDVPGNYQLYEDLNIRTMTIEVSGVCLDLNGHEILFDGTNNVSGISIDAPVAGASLNRIKICNGRIVDGVEGTGLSSGIHLVSDQTYQVSEVLIEDVTVADCFTGVYFEGEYAGEVIDCELVRLDLVGNAVGCRLNRADDNLVRDCCATYNTNIAFDLIHSEGNIFRNCCALKTVGDGSVSGFKTNSGKTNLFENCVVKKAITEAEDFCNKAHGFLLTGTEEKTKIIECIVNEVDMTTTVSAVSYGIFLEPTIEYPGAQGVWQPGDDLLAPIFEYPLTSIGSGRSVVWAPDSRHLAVAGAGGADKGNVAVFGFDGQTAEIIATVSVEQDVTTVDWSPDNNFIVVGRGTFVDVYRFDGSSLLLADSYAVEADDIEVFSVVWSPDGHHIAVGTEAAVRVLSFDENQTLRELGSFSGFEGTKNFVCWSPDGRNIGVAQQSSRDIFVFNFDGRNIVYIDHLENVLTPVDELLTSIAWSPNGTFIAAGGYDVAAPSSSLVVVAFNGVALSPVLNEDRDALAVDWSPCGKFVAMSCGIALGRLVQVDAFNLNPSVAEVKWHTAPDDICAFSLSWSSEGKYIATVEIYTGKEEVPTQYLRIFKAMYGPEHCFARGCSICDVAAFNQFAGTGITAGGTNCFFDNICCNNDVDFSFGIPNVVYGNHNLHHQPMENVATQRDTYIIKPASLGDGGGSQED